MTRLKALEAVADAARGYEKDVRKHGLRSPEASAARENLFVALDALPAAPDPARGEVVEMAVWRVGDHYELTVPQLIRGNHCELLGTARFPLTGDGA